jgi:amino acid transporter
MDHNRMQHNNALARRISLPLLLFYGLGTILGAGIYVLVGKIAAASGFLAPLAFLVAAVVAGITALSYCQLVVMLPRSSGEAYYVDQAFGTPNLTRFVGLLVVLTGVVSCATLANGFVGYLQTFIEVPAAIAVICVVVFMTGLALWGIAESLWAATIVTLIEIGGLILVVFVGGGQIDATNLSIEALFVPTSLDELALVLAGAFLAFYAFVGFEDMVNIVEEVKEPERNMPKAIILALLISSSLYILVALVAILGMPLDTLAASEAPLKHLLEIHSAEMGQWISVISLFAIVNGVLTQIIMASRVLYGMANQQRLPMVFAAVSSKTKTPWVATITVALIVLVLALGLPLVTLAAYTSFSVLCVFTLVNVALLKLRKRPDLAAKAPDIISFPKVGAGLCVCLLVFQLLYVL